MSAPPRVDTPYIETVRTAFVFNSTAHLPTNWQRLSTSPSTQMLSTPRWFILVDMDGLHVGASMEKLTQVQVTGTSTVLRGAVLTAVDYTTTTTTLAGMDATGARTFALTCDFHGAAPTCSKLRMSPRIEPPLGTPSAAAIVRGSQLWAGGTGGLVAWSIGNASSPPYRLLHGQHGVRTLAANESHVAVATASKLLMYRAGTAPASTVRLRDEWVTDIVTTRGGPISSSIGAVSFGPSGALYINTATSLDVRAADGTIHAYTGVDGLPCANGTALAITPLPSPSPALSLSPPSTQPPSTQPPSTQPPSTQPPSAEHQLWMACDRGVALVDLNSTDGSPVRGSYRYFRGARWLPGDDVALGLAVVPTAPKGRVDDPDGRVGARNTEQSRQGQGDGGGGRAEASQSPIPRRAMAPGISILTGGGVAVLEQQLWTLSEKAAHYQAMVPRHRRHQLVTSLQLAAFGTLEGATTTDTDNDGLWTSIAMAAQALRSGVNARGQAHGQEGGNSESADARALAFSFFQGLETLVNVTGVDGLPARTVVGPGEAHHSGAHDKTQWHNSSVSGYKGWQWKGDTSSDEIVGHLFAYPMARALATLPRTNERRRVEGAQLAIAGGIASHGLKLIDVTGKPTTWGRWDPATLNDQRNFSDERGVNSAQLLSFMLTANATAAAIGDAKLSSLLGGTATQVASGADDYATNVLNAKITATCDDNYSDDELLMLPLYAALAWAPAHPHITPALRAALGAAFSAEIGSERSALWGAIYLAEAAGGVAGASLLEAERALDDVLWSLRTWPLEMIDWPVTNSERLDITYRSAPDRFGHTGRSVRVLPANERRQYRWNADPFDVRDGGDGMSETDSGAWLLAYWLARYHGLV